MPPSAKTVFNLSIDGIELLVCAKQMRSIPFCDEMTALSQILDSVGLPFDKPRALLFKRFVLFLYRVGGDVEKASPQWHDPGFFTTKSNYTENGILLNHGLRQFTWNIKANKISSIYQGATIEDSLSPAGFAMMLNAVYLRGHHFGNNLFTYDDKFDFESADKYLDLDRGETSILTAFFRAFDFGFFKHLVRAHGGSGLGPKERLLIKLSAKKASRKAPAKLQYSGIICLSEAQGDNDWFEIGRITLKQEIKILLKSKK